VRIQLVREGENPWYEMTLVEGRNRQIRRMFQEIGHHVEKIRRVRYGPLELDVEPGKLRHLTTKEVAQLKAAASGRKAGPRTTHGGI
jgi:23S rRNA pseudouridine2605 synthase